MAPRSARRGLSGSQPVQRPQFPEQELREQLVTRLVRVIAVIVAERAGGRTAKMLQCSQQRRARPVGHPLHDILVLVVNLVQLPQAPRSQEV